MRIGIVGTGAMGRPVIDRLLAANHSVRAYTRREEVAKSLAAAGAQTTGSLSEVGAGCELVLIYVLTDEQVQEIAITGGLIEAMDSGSILVVHTTGSPHTMKALADFAEKHDIQVVDAPGSGGPREAANGALNLFIGGDQESVEHCRPVFSSYAHKITHFGELGSGQAVKLINNLLFSCHVQLALEAARISKGFGIDECTLSQTLSTCSGQSYSLDLVASIGSAEKLLSVAGPYILKDVKVAKKVAKSIGLSLGTFDALAEPLIKQLESAAG